MVHQRGQGPHVVWCHGCGSRAVGHGRNRTQVRDLSIAGVATVLVFARRRRRCAEAWCTVATWSEHVDAIAPRAALTERVSEHEPRCRRRNGCRPAGSNEIAGSAMIATFSWRIVRVLTEYEPALRRDVW